MTSMREGMDVLRTENANLRRNVEKLQVENRNLRKRLEKYEKPKKEFEQQQYATLKGVNERRGASPHEVSAKEKRA